MKWFRRSRRASSAIPKSPRERYALLAAPNADVVVATAPIALRSEPGADDEPARTIRAASDLLEEVGPSMPTMGATIPALVDACMTHVELGYPARLKHRVADAVSEGVALGLLEQRSGQALPGLVHPSIGVAMSFARVAAAKELAKIPCLPQAFATVVVDQARRGGHFWARRPEVAPADVFAGCAFTE